MSTHDDTEARLRQALHGAADRVDVDEYGSLDRIRSRAGAARRRRRIVAGGAGVALALVAVVVAVPLMLERDDKVSLTPPAGPGEDPSTTTTEPPSPTTTTPDSPPQGSVFPASVDDATDDPVATVDGFLEALDYGSSYDLEVARLDDHEFRTVLVRGRREDGGAGPIRSEVSLRSDDGLWYVMGAASSEIEIDSPVAGEAVGSPVTVSGRGQGYEAQLIVTVRDAELRALNEPTIDSGLPLAGSGEDLEPFTTTIEFAGQPGPGAVVVMNTSGMEDGAVGLAVVPVVLAPEGATTVQVFLLDGEDPVAVTRTVPHTTGVLNAAIGALLAGPTPQDEAAGYTSSFSSATADLGYEVNVRDGIAVVDFDLRLQGLIPSASSAAGSAALLAQLDSTVFQFPSITGVEYRLGGDCEAFWEWLQQSCHVVSRR